MRNNSIPLPCRRLRQIDRSLCVRKEGCPLPLGQTGCFRAFEDKHGTFKLLSRLITTGYRLWETKVAEGVTTKRRNLIAPLSWYEPIPGSFDDARDDELLALGGKAVRAAARAIRSLCHPMNRHGNGYTGDEVDIVEQPTTPAVFYGVNRVNVENDARRKVGRGFLKDE